MIEPKALCRRHEREMTQCKHPAIRLIQERDASPASTMVLCVFEINWPAEGDSEGSTACPGLFSRMDGIKSVRRQINPLQVLRGKAKFVLDASWGLLVLGWVILNKMLLDVDLHIPLQLDTEQRSR